MSQSLTGQYVPKCNYLGWGCFLPHLTTYILPIPISPAVGKGLYGFVLGF